MLMMSHPQHPSSPEQSKEPQQQRHMPTLDQQARINLQMMQQRNIQMQQNAMGAGLAPDDYTVEQLEALAMAKRMRIAQQQARDHHQQSAHTGGGLLMDPSTRLLLLQQQDLHHRTSLGLTGGLGFSNHLFSQQRPRQLSMNGGPYGDMNQMYPFASGMTGMGVPGSMQLPVGTNSSFMNASASLGNPFYLGGGHHEAIALGRQASSNSTRKDPSGKVIEYKSPPKEGAMPETAEAEPADQPSSHHRSPEISSAIEREILKRKSSQGRSHAARKLTKRKREEQVEGEKGRGSPLDKLSSLASFMVPAPVVLPDLYGNRGHLATADVACASNLANASTTDRNGNVQKDKLSSTAQLERQHEQSGGSTGSEMEFTAMKKYIVRTPSTSATDVPHYLRRDCMALSIDEDANWLSEFQHFLRQEILEVFVASNRDVQNRTASKKIAATQVGLRCRFCAHLHPSERASRSSAFPSSCSQIYQSFTMMLREHLSGQCQSIPPATRQHFMKLKSQSAQSASDSKRYWIYAAKKLGMSDSAETGIQWSPPSDEKNGSVSSSLPPFGTSAELELDLREAARPNTVHLVCEHDKPVVSDFIYAVVQESVLVHLAASERIGNRSCLKTGLPGMACRYCCLAGRSGLSRVFPARKRNLKTKVQDLHDHLRRCTLVPVEVKDKLKRLRVEEQQGLGGDKKTKIFYARLWRRLGHDDDGTPAAGPPASVTKPGVPGSAATSALSGSAASSRPTTPSSSL